MQAVKKKRSRTGDGVIDRKGRAVIPKSEKIGYFSEGLIPVLNGGKWGYFNESGDVAIDFIYDWADNFSNGSAIVGMN